MRILGAPTASFGRVAVNADRRGAHIRFLDEMMEPLWAQAMGYGIDPVVVVAQAAKETAWGAFTGRVPAGFYNPCGLKVRVPDPSLPADHTLHHAQFASWDLGAHAHCQHLLAYAQVPLPKGVALADPRWVWVYGRGEPVVEVEGLGGRWAPSSSYGQEVVAIAKDLSALPL